MFIDETHPKFKPIATLRERIAAYRQEIVSIETGRLNVSDAKARIKALVDHARQADRLCPIRAALVQQGLLDFGERNSPAPAILERDPLSLAFELLCQLSPEIVRTGLEREIANHCDPKALPLADRPKAIEKLRREIRKFEIEEETLIEKLEAEGFNVHRRDDCDMAIVLGKAA